MYQQFYGLTGKPFQLTPDPKFFYGSKTHSKALAYLTYGLQQGEGFIIITGEIGAGKTTMVRHLIADMSDKEFTTALVVSTQLAGHDLLAAIAHAFGIATNASDKAGSLLQLQTFFEAQAKAGKRVILIVDEAQNLSVEALEELRMLSNFQMGGDAVLQSFLVGQPEFRDKVFNSPQLDQLRQRVIASHHLQALQAEEVRDYVEYRLSRVGWASDPSFEDGFYDALFEATGGIPRILNTLCGRLLLFGYLEDKHILTAADVRLVASEFAEEVGVRKGAGSAATLTANTRLLGTNIASDAASETGLSPTSLAALQLKALDERVAALEEALETQQNHIHLLEVMLRSKNSDREAG